jgi:hypothetical protein
MSDDMQTDDSGSPATSGMNDAEPKRRGRPPKDGPDREAREPRSELRAEPGRRARIPLGTPQTKLGAKVPKGMVGRWVNDVGARVQQALNAGYEFINDAGTTGSRESGRVQIVGVKEDGSPMHGYLMAIPEDWHKEDQAAKQKPLDAFEAEIRRGIPQGADAQGEAGAFYNKGTVLERR